VSFLKRLFGGSGGGAPTAATTQEHKGYTITAHPVAEGGRHRISGTISREIDGARREKRFDRADQLDTRDAAIEFTFQKGRLMIDQQGDGIFD
jgi:hypothetical protein